MSSQVAQLRERLQLEAASLYQGLHGYAEVAKHQIIQQRYNTIGKTLYELKQHISDKEAACFILHALEQALEKHEEETNNGSSNPSAH